MQAQKVIHETQDHGARGQYQAVCIIEKRVVDQKAGKSEIKAEPEPYPIMNDLEFFKVLFLPFLGFRKSQVSQHQEEKVNERKPHGKGFEESQGRVVDGKHEDTVGPNIKIG